MNETLEKIFHLKEHGTNVRTEILAGITTFMTMAYILAVNPNIFGRSKVKFLSNYFRQVDRLGFKYELRRDMEPLFTKLLDVCSIFVSKQDCLDLPDMVSVVHSVDLAPATMKLYKEMEREQVLFLQDRNITAMNKLTSLMKLRQITSGFIIDTEGKSIFHSWS